MKFFAVFAAVLAFAAAESSTQWTLQDLDSALSNPATPAAMIPYLEEALNTLMASLFTGKPLESVAVSTPAGLLPVDAIAPIEVAPVIVPEVTTQWTLHDLSMALQNPATPAEYVPYLEAALDTLMESMFTGNPMGSIAVSTPAGLLPVEAITPIDVTPAIVPEVTTQWTLHDLSMALQNPATPAEYVPYLEAALNTMMESLFSGKPVESIAVPTPAGLLPVEAITPIEVSPVAVAQPEPVVIAPAPVAVAQPEPVVIAPAPVGVAPAAVGSASPLVQIIVNIKSQETAPVAPAPEAPEAVIVPEAPESVVIAPSPIEIAPELPEAVVIVPEAPETVVIVPSPIVIAPEVPEPVVIAPAPIVIPETPALNPIDIIAVGAPDVNPIDLLQPVPVAVAAPEVNPIDLLQPVPVAVAGGASNGQLV